MNPNNQQLAFSICDFLSSCIDKGIIQNESVEGIEVAIQCISEAFQVDYSSETDKQKYSIKPANLSTIFDTFLSTKKALEGSHSSTSKDSARKAEELKNTGNDYMKQEKFQDAIASYSDAIHLDPKNAVYYGNRSAAYARLSKYEDALADANKALEVDPSYTKAYSRAAHALFYLQRIPESIEAYEKAIKADPSNEALKKSLASAKEELSRDAPSTTSKGPLDGLGGLGGMDLGSMMSNPGFMQMASQMMSNPAFSSMMQNPNVAEMAQNLMKNPDALNNLMANPEIAKMAGDIMKK